MTRLLVDGSGLACRLWWGSQHETEQRFLNLVTRASADLLGPPTIAWDSPPPTWRHEIYPAYKAGRPGKPQALRDALRGCRGLPQLHHVEVPGFEADDVIATLARRILAGLEDSVLILAEDKDFAQLVGPRCRLLSARGEITDEAAVIAKWGVPPNRIQLLLSWWGDHTDNLPGVRGVGRKKAIPKALDGVVGDELTYELAGLATVPERMMR